jgi:transposase-like protein
MNPPTQVCHTPHGPARGQRGQGNLRVHSHVEQRYRCTRCGPTVAATTGMPFYRWRPAMDGVTVVLTLVGHGCPRHALVAAFGVDEHTGAAWLVRAGHHRRQGHQPSVQRGGYHRRAPC